MPSLSLHELSKSYGDSVGLAPISAKFSCGVTGLIGANGAGKSTLFKLLAQLDSPTQGHILFDGINVSQDPSYLRSNLGLLPQHFGCYENLTAKQFLSYIAGIKGIATVEANVQIEELLEKLNLAHTDKQLLRDFSGGMRQRIGIAQAMLGHPKLLILDEPSVGLDPQERVSLRKILKEVAKTSIVLVSSHIVSDIETIADRILVLSSGNVAAHMSIADLIAEMQGKVWRTSVDVEQITDYETRFLVSDIRHQKEGAMLRIVSATAPDADAVQVAPDLEDAYLYYTHNPSHSIQ